MRDGSIDDVCNHSRHKFFSVENIECDCLERVIKTSLRGPCKIHAIQIILPTIIDTQPDESDGDLDAHQDEDRTDPERTEEEGDI